MKFFYPKLLLILFTLQGASTLSLAHFSSKGPFGGGISCAITHDTTVYLGTFNGGVFESTNTKLIGWRARPVGLKNGRITALTHSGKYLFAGTADSGVYIFNGFEGSERYWVKINTGLTSLKITALVAIDSITVLAGTSDAGIFRTTDKGASWTAVNNAVLHHLDITALVKAGSRIIHTAYSGGAYASDDMGATWISLNDSQTDDIDGTISVSYNAVRDEIIFINKDGVYRTTAASTTTAPVYSLVESGLPSNVKIHAVSNDGNNWYLATDNGVFVSATSAISWSSISTGLTSMDVYAVVPFQNKLLGGTKTEGVFKAALPFTTWSPMNTSFNNLKIYSMATSGANVVIAATEKGVFASRDLAATYVRSNKGLTDSLNVTDLAFTGANLLATTKNGGVFWSTDTGRSWIASNMGLGEFNINKVYTSGPDLFIISSTGVVYQATTSHIHWYPVQVGLPSGAKPNSIAFQGSNMILGTLGHGVFIRGISSGNWAAINAGLTNLNVTSVTATSQKIFAGTDGSGVFVSDASTVSWAPTATTSIHHTGLMGLNGSKIQAMAANARYVFASYRGGLLATSDNGATWIEGGNQYNLPSYADIHKIAFTTARVFVTTPYNSLYSNALSELPAISGIQDQQETANFFRITPNPNEGQFSIDLKDFTTKIEEIRIYDLSGRNIQRIVNPLELHISVNCPQGLYMVHVQSKGKMFTKKMVVN